MVSFREGICAFREHVGGVWVAEVGEDPSTRRVARSLLIHRATLREPRVRGALERADALLVHPQRTAVGGAEDGAELGEASAGDAHATGCR